MSEEIKIVDSKPEFSSFIINSFLKSYRGQKTVKDREFFATYSPIIVDYLSRFEVKVAVNPADEDQIYGWFMSDLKTNTLVYAYTKYTFRQFGIFNALAMASGLNWDEQVFYRFHTHSGSYLAKSLKLIHSELPI